LTFLLDSDRVIDYLLGQSAATALLQLLESEGLAISEVTFGEIYDGIFHSKDPVAAEIVFQRFLTRVTVLSLSPAIWKRFAHIRGSLRRRGQLIPDFDILIAATAIHHDLTLVTRNQKHLARIPGLKLDVEYDDTPQ
jgi:tRNA(fMet)-specific endonuclease VapC